MGKLYKRGGTWYADFYDRAGIRRQKSTRTGDPQVARARLRDLELQTTDSGTHPTQALADALDYFTEVTCASKAAGTRSSYAQKARHVSRLLGGHTLDGLQREHVERYIATRLQEGAHPHSVHKELVVLRGALKSGRARGLFHGAIDVVPEYEFTYEPRRTYLTQDQFMRLADHLVPAPAPRATAETIATMRERRDRRLFHVMLIAFVGPRKGELESMRWEQHVDLARGKLIVAKGKTVSRPVSIAAELRPWLDAFGDRSSWHGPLVAPWGSITRDLDRACARAAIPRVTCNDLRRTFASWLVQQHVSLWVVAALLGHSSTRMVEQVYGRLDEATLDDAIARLPGGSHAGVTRGVPNRGTAGAGGTSASPPSIVNSVEESANSAACVVPRDGVEPPTRGFSGPFALPAPTTAKPARSRAKLRAV